MGCQVHQPTESFLRKMSGCVVMTPGGRLIYAGPMRTGGGCGGGGDERSPPHGAPRGACAISAALEGYFPNIRALSPNVAEAVIELVLSDDLGTERQLARLYDDCLHQEESR